MSKLTHGRGTLIAIVLAAVGFSWVLIARSRLAEWEFLGDGTRLTYSVLLGSGALLGAGACVLLARRAFRWPLVVVSGAAGVLGATLLLGLAAGTIPCSGPG